MTLFIDWLRVELLRLRSLDWGNGSKRAHFLKDGVLKFNSFYSVNDLSSELGLSEDEFLDLIDSPTVRSELEEKSFTAGWSEGKLTLSWLEEGISQLKSEESQDYFEEDGDFYIQTRSIERAIYLDGTERIVKDSGQRKPARISEEAFIAAQERIGHGLQESSEQSQEGTGRITMTLKESIAKRRLVE